MVALLDADDIGSALQELATRLDEAGVQARIRLMGGAAVALDFPERGLTADAEALYQPTAEVEATAAVIARERGWPTDWLNKKIQMYASDLDHEAEWETLFAIGSVTVLVAPPDLLLAMKLKASRGRRDSEDIDVLIRRCGVESIAAAEEIFDHHYPRDEMPERGRRQLEARFA